MKLRSALICALAISATVTIVPKAFAGTNATVEISGTVSSSLNMSTTSLSAASNLDLTSTTEQIIEIADLAIDTNNSEGYILTVTSGELSKADGKTSIPFQVAVQDEGIVPDTSAFTASSGTNYTYTTSEANGVGNNQKSLFIKYTPATLQDPGTYNATVNLTVADN